MKRTLLLLALSFVVLALPVSAADKVWTLNSDFDQGILVNLNHNPADQLQLNSVPSTFPYIGVAASGRGTMIRIDTNTGAIVGEYWTSPNGMSRNPSRTTTDLFGNTWVSNRDESGWVGAGAWSAGQPPTSRNRGSVTKIGLIIGGTRVNGDGTPNPSGLYLAPPFAYNTCRDQNGDGLIKTSAGLGDIRNWPYVTDWVGGNTALVEDADDECILVFQRTEGYGNRHVSVDAQNHVWVGGYPYTVSDQYFNKLNGDTGHIMTSFHQNCGGYGGFTDGHGVVWSAGLSDGHLLRYDPATNTQLCIEVGNSYGLAPDKNGYVWNNLWTSNQVAKFDAAGSMVPGFPKPTTQSGGRGAVVTPADNHVWLAHSYSNTVTRMDNTGNLLKVIPVGDHPTGVTVDSNGKVWVTNYNASTVMRIDPNGGGDGLGAVDLTVGLGGGAYPYNYSDMTGVINIATTMPRGAWVVTYDSGVAATPWGKLVWNSEGPGVVPAGAKITVEARAADTTSGLALQEFVPVVNGVQFAQVGRFIELRTTLYPNASGQSPVLSDMQLTKRSAAVCDVNNDGAVNRADINLIFSSIGQLATGPNDPRDADGDGKITIYDSRKCVVACTKANCAL